LPRNVVELSRCVRATRVVSAEADASITHGDLTALLFLQGYAKDEFVVG
jgi:phosphoserine phosphatase